MSEPEDDPREERLARGRKRAASYRAWLEQLRGGDPAFAEASALQAADRGEWQAAVYLLTGCQEVWDELVDAVLGDCSIAPVITELYGPRRPWAPAETAVLQWAAHFWDADRRPARFPLVFGQSCFYRWVNACHLRRRIAPAVTQG